MKKIIALVLALVMIMALATTAFAVRAAAAEDVIETSSPVTVRHLGEPSEAGGLYTIITGKKGSSTEIDVEEYAANAIATLLYQPAQYLANVLKENYKAMSDQIDGILKNVDDVRKETKANIDKATVQTREAATFVVEAGKIAYQGVCVVAKTLLDVVGADEAADQFGKWYHHAAENAVAVEDGIYGIAREIKGRVSKISKEIYEITKYKVDEETGIAGPSWGTEWVMDRVGRFISTLTTPETFAHYDAATGEGGLISEYLYEHVFNDYKMPG